MKQRFSRIMKSVAPIAMIAALTAFSPASAFAAPRGGGGHGGGFAGGGHSFAAPARGFSGGGHVVAPRVYGGGYVGRGYYGPRIGIGLGFGVGAYPYGYAPYGYVAPYDYAAPYAYPAPAPYGYSAAPQTCNPAGYYDQNGVWQATPGCAAPPAQAAPAPYNQGPSGPAPDAPYGQ